MGHFVPVSALTLGNPSADKARPVSSASPSMLGAELHRYEEKPQPATTTSQIQQHPSALSLQGQRCRQAGGWKEPGAGSGIG